MIFGWVLGAGSSANSATLQGLCVGGKWLAGFGLCYLGQDPAVRVGGSRGRVVRGREKG